MTRAMLGSLYIIDVASYEDARQFIAEEPPRKGRPVQVDDARGWMAVMTIPD